MIQITQTGLRPASEMELAQWQAEYADRHCVILPQLIEPALLRRLWRQIESSAFETRVHRRMRQAEPGPEFSKDLMISSSAVALHHFLLLFNHSGLFEIVRRITNCPPIGGFSGRIYRIVPGLDHHLDWHEDTNTGNYLVGISINLSTDPYQGGVFQIRERHTQRLTGEVPQPAPGDAHLFSISPKLEHRVTPLSGHVARTAGAGWFCVESDYLSELKSRSAGHPSRRPEMISGLRRDA